MATLTPTEAAERLKVAEKTLANWRAQGVGPAFVRVGRIVRYTDEDLASWLKSKARTSTADHHLKEPTP
jgi:excisionase family DNA binding protein